jgi:hypothetical protein
VAGGNCSNRGCDFTIYKEGPKGQWRKIFDEHLYAKHLAIDWAHMRLQLMVVSIGAADPRCHPEPKRHYTTGMSCNLIVTYRNNKWNWQSSVPASLGNRYKGLPGTPAPLLLSDWANAAAVISMVASAMRG